MYIKIQNHHIKYLNDFIRKMIDIQSTHQHVNGVLVLSKQCNIKQILIDYETIGVFDYSKVFKKDKRMKLLELISNNDPYHNFVLTFDIETSYNTKSFKCGNVPNIYQFIKVAIYSIIRQVHNHLYITPLDDRYIISMKKNLYFELYETYKKTKCTMSDFINIIFKKINEIYHTNIIDKNDIYSIPDEIHKYFNIYHVKNKDINVPYTFYKISI